MENWLRKSEISIETMSAIFMIVFVSLFVLANFVTGFVWPLFILAMTVGFGISLAYPRSGILAIVFLTIVWERFFTLQTFFIGKVEYKIYPLDVLMLGIFLSIAVQYIFSKEKIKWNRIDWMLIVFCLINAAYFVFSLIILKSDTSLAFSSLKNYAFYSLLYFAVIFLFRDIESLRKLFRFFLAGAVAVIAFILIGFIGGEGLWSGYTPLSTSGVRKLAFTHGLYLALAFFPMMLWMVFREWKTVAMGKSVTYLLLAIWLVGIIGTLMRHLWLALAGVFLLLLFFLPKERRAGLLQSVCRIAAPFAVLGVFVFYFIFMNPQSSFSRSLEGSLGVVSERAASLVNSQSDESFFWRNLVWKSAYERFKLNPIFGIGTGEMIYVEDRANHYKDYIELRNIHNSYLSILFQLGLLGAATFFIFIYSNVKVLLRSKGDDCYDFYRFSILSVLAIYILSIPFQPYLETNLLAIFFWMGLGAARALPEIKQ